MTRRWILGGLGGLVLASTLWARPGVVKTRDGQTFDGDITEQGTQIIIERKSIRTTLSRQSVLSVSYSDSLDEACHRRLAKLNPSDVPGRLELARWLFENRALELSRQVLEDALRIQPHNHDVVDLILTIDRQEELNVREARRHEPIQLAAADNNPRTGAPPARASGHPAGRLLTSDEINRVKQDEWQQGQQVTVRFLNDVRRKYIARSGAQPAEFNRLTPPDQAWAILRRGTDEMRKDVILGDPPAMQQFKKVQRTIVTACANCHNDLKPEGNFALHFPAETEAATYTNFILLQRYQHKEGDRTRMMIDRERPDSSLLVQFALPSDIGDPPHPAAQNYRGVVRTRNDPRLKGVVDWISALAPVVPDYGDIDLTPRPTSRPATGAPPRSQPPRRGATTR